MNRRIGAVGIAVLTGLAGVLLACRTPARAEGPPAQPRLGINLAGAADWNTELPFVDVFRLSRRWVSQRKGRPWGKGPELALDDRGWVKHLESDSWAESPLCTIEGGHYPAGRYVVLYDGRGELNATIAARKVSEKPGRVELDINPARGGFFLQLKATDPADPVRNIRVIMPGFEKTVAENPWNPSFLDRWRGVACLRFMDLMATNGSKIRTWADRPRPDDATFTNKGVAPELLIDLANRLDADAWFCIPHEADDDYVRQFATLVRDTLNPRRKVYVEYSNEVWNGMFAQHKYAGEQGRARGYADKSWEAAWRFTAQRSVEIFTIFETVFRGRERLVRVLPTQSVNPSVSEQILTFHDAYRHADALAIAPYLGFSVKPGGKPGVEEVAGWSVDQVLDHVENVALKEATNAIHRQKALADRYGLKLVAYEGGQHLVGILGGENHAELTRKFHQANAHPRMGAIYQRYYDAWTREGGDLFCHFSSVSNWSKWGSWGLLQYSDDDPATSPKFVATMTWARRCGQAVVVPRGQAK